MSLNLRIIISASIVLTVFIALTGATLDRAFYQSTKAALDDKLSSSLYMLMAATEVDDNGKISIQDRLLEKQFSLPRSGLYSRITNRDHNVIWRSRSTLNVDIPPPKTLVRGAQQLVKQKAANEEFYTMAYGVNWTVESGVYPLTFNVTIDLNAFYKQINHYRTNLWGWLVAMAILLLVTQIVIFRWSLYPLRRVGDELSKIDNGEQDNIEGDYPTELKRLTDSINTLVKHERHQKSCYRNALGDLAHSLKTPLAVLRASLSEEATSHAPKKIFDEQITRMDRIVEYQLQRAATAGNSLTFRLVLIKPTVEKITQSLQKVYQDKAIAINIDLTEEVAFKGDEGDLMEILGNLIDNAFKWSNHRIDIKAVQEKHKIIISVDDDGPGIDDGKIKSLMERGARADQTIAGHGIGLSIVQNIVQAYQGNLRIEKSRLGGARFIVILNAGGAGNPTERRGQF